MLRKALLLGVAMMATPVFAAETGKDTPAPNADSVTRATVVVDGMTIPYQAVAGTILVHGAGYNDSNDVLNKRGVKV